MCISADKGEHLLDAGIYRELLAEIRFVGGCGNDRNNRNNNNDDIYGFRNGNNNFADNDDNNIPPVVWNNNNNARLNHKCQS